MTKAAVFASGSGTNFEALMSHQEDGSLDCEIVCLIADRENAYARERARNHSIPEFCYIQKNYPSKKEYETDILNKLKELDVDLIILSGYMRYIGQVLLENYPGRIINIHPAWLPEFPGAHGIQDAFEAKVPQTGVTVHYVDEGVDTGPVILQERVPIDPGWDLETLENHVHAKEYDLFWRAVNQAVSELTSKKTEDE